VIAIAKVVLVAKRENPDVGAFQHNMMTTNKVATVVAQRKGVDTDEPQALIDPTKGENVGTIGLCIEGEATANLAMTLITAREQAQSIKNPLPKPKNDTVVGAVTALVPMGGAGRGRGAVTPSTEGTRRVTVPPRGITLLQATRMQMGAPRIHRCENLGGDRRRVAIQPNEINNTQARRVQGEALLIHRCEGLELQVLLRTKRTRKSIDIGSTAKKTSNDTDAMVNKKIMKSTATTPVEKIFHPKEKRDPN
jgi:hypothetical protein